MENIMRCFTPADPSLTLTRKSGEAFGKIYLEWEVTSNNFPKMPRQFYIFCLCDDNDEEIKKNVFNFAQALEKQYPGYTWPPSTLCNMQSEKKFI